MDMSINTALYNGLSGLNSYGTALSVVSDNVSNANTTAFKSNSVRFGDMVNSYYATLTNDTEREGAGVSVMGFASDFGQGNIVDTSNWTDMSVSGDGYFEVLDGAIHHYTRDGSFHIEVDADGNGILTSQQGYSVLGDDGATPVTIPDYADYSNFRVGTDGQVYGVDTTTGQEEPITDAIVGLTVFSNQNGLIREGSNLYSEGADSGTATTNGDAGADPALFGNVLDNSLEGSNVDLSKEMVDMIIYQAGFNANSKTITTSSSLLDTTIAMVR
jgi:flagellar hook protein FlgE